MHPNFERTTDGRVVVRKRDGTYHVDIEAGPTFEGATLNMAGRAAAFPDDGALELGGGDSEIVVRGYDDDRHGGQLLAVGFQTDSCL